MTSLAEDHRAETPNIMSAEYYVSIRGLRSVWPDYRIGDCHGKSDPGGPSSILNLNQIMNP